MIGQGTMEHFLQVIKKKNIRNIVDRKQHWNADVYNNTVSTSGMRLNQNNVFSASNDSVETPANHNFAKTVVETQVMGLCPAAGGLSY